MSDREVTRKRLKVYTNNYAFQTVTACIHRGSQGRQGISIGISTHGFSSKDWLGQGTKDMHRIIILDRLSIAKYW